MSDTCANTYVDLVSGTGLGCLVAADTTPVARRKHEAIRFRSVTRRVSDVLSACHGGASWRRWCGADAAPPAHREAGTAPPAAPPAHCEPGPPTPAAVSPAARRWLSYLPQAVAPRPVSLSSRLASGRLVC